MQNRKAQVVLTLTCLWIIAVSLPTIQFEPANRDALLIAVVLLLTMIKRHAKLCTATVYFQNGGFARQGECPDCPGEDCVNPNK